MNCQCCHYKYYVSITTTYVLSVATTKVLSVLPLQRYCQCCHYRGTVSVATSKVLSVLPLQRYCQCCHFKGTVSVATTNVLSVLPLQMYCQCCHYKGTVSVATTKVLSVLPLQRYCQCCHYKCMVSYTTSNVSNTFHYLIIPPATFTLSWYMFSFNLKIKIYDIQIIQLHVLFSHKVTESLLLFTKYHKVAFFSLFGKILTSSQSGTVSTSSQSGTLLAFLHLLAHCHLLHKMAQCQQLLCSLHGYDKHVIICNRKLPWYYCGFNNFHGYQFLWIEGKKFVNIWFCGFAKVCLQDYRKICYSLLVYLYPRNPRKVVSNE